MALDLDDRRRAMLAEIGIRVWLPRQPSATSVPPAAADPVATPSIAPPPKCRSPGDRNPVQGEINPCSAILRRQIELVQPKLVLLVGRIAVRSVLQTDQPIGRLRGTVHRVQNTLAVVTYPPEHLIRHPQDKAKAWEDLCLAMWS